MTDRIRDRAALWATALALFASSGLSGGLALQHMRELGRICGQMALAPHCGWCVATVGLALAGITAAVAAARPEPVRAKTR
jgi:hypothetical protein